VCALNLCRYFGVKRTVFILSSRVRAPGDKNAPRGRGRGRMLSSMGAFNVVGGIAQAGVPPPTYTCHRCGQHGHYIQLCPTNNDPNFDNRRLKAAVGIPKSSLHVVNDAEQTDARFVTGDGMVAVFKANETAFRAGLGLDADDDDDAYDNTNGTAAAAAAGHASANNESHADAGRTIVSGGVVVHVA
jgi:hypothetical protein